MRWLVIRNVLPGDAKTVDMILHKRYERVPGLDSGGAYAQRLAVIGAPDNFFSPVAEEVSAQNGCCLSVLLTEGRYLSRLFR